MPAGPGLQLQHLLRVPGAQGDPAHALLQGTWPCKGNSVPQVLPGDLGSRDELVGNEPGEPQVCLGHTPVSLLWCVSQPSVPAMAWVTAQCPCCGVCHSTVSPLCPGSQPSVPAMVCVTAQCLSHALCHRPVSLQCPGSQPSVQPGSPNFQATPVRCSPSIFAFLFHLWIWAGSFLGWGRTGQVQVSPPPTLTLSQDLSQQTALQMSKSSKSTNKKHPQYKFMSKVME